MYEEHIRAAARSMAENMQRSPVPMYGKGLRLPDKGAVIGLLKEIRRLVFPAYYGDPELMTLLAEDYTALLLERIEGQLTRQIALALPEEQEQRAPMLAREVVEALPGVQRLLLTDLDYTLAPKAVRRPDDALRQWIDGLKGAGITVMIVSNNRSGVRVTEFCGDLGIGYQGHAGKPSPKGLRAAMERTGADPAHTAMLGDKLLTDMLAAHRAGVRAWMVEPLGGPVGLWNHVLHLLQRPFKRACPYKCQKNPGENTK